MTELIWHVIMDAVGDTLRLVPFLFLTYLVMEYLEHKTQDTTQLMIRRAGKLGPLIGGIAGVFPQCGFSAAASSFYAGGVISVGTLMAVFLSTSDEMLPIFISEAVELSVILKILGLKIVIGAVSGFLLDFFWKVGSRKRKEYHEHRHVHREHHAVHFALTLVNSPPRVKNLHVLVLAHVAGPCIVEVFPDLDASGRLCIPKIFGRLLIIGQGQQFVGHGFAQGLDEFWIGGSIHGGHTLHFTIAGVAVEKIDAIEIVGFET